MGPPRIVGLDLSLTANVICYSDGTVDVIKPHCTDVERLFWFDDQLNSRLRWWMSDLTVIEGYSYNSRNGGERLGELGGIIRLALYESGIPYVEVPPATLKKYSTGKGNASKDQVLVAGVKRSGIEFADNNACDAWWLRAMALDHYGYPVVQMPAAHRAALAAVQWPALGEAGAA